MYNNWVAHFTRRAGETTFRVIVLSTLLIITSCSKRSAQENEQTPNTIKFQQYYVHGEQLYSKHCSNCHQKNGQGLGLLYPPLKDSDFINQNFEATICLIRNGIKGELIVNGKSYNKAMPGIPSLTDLDIAEISTYIYNTWGNKRDSIDVLLVSKVLGRCDSQKVSNQ